VRAAQQVAGVPLDLEAKSSHFGWMVVARATTPQPECLEPARQFPDLLQRRVVEEELAGEASTASIRRLSPPLIKAVVLVCPTRPTHRSSGLNLIVNSVAAPGPSRPSRFSRAPHRGHRRALPSGVAREKQFIAKAWAGRDG
jgi:hypothetical protein